MNKKSNITNDNKQSFWTTLPGILTAIAAVITAIGGLIVAIDAAGLIGTGTPQPLSSGASPLPTTIAQTSVPATSSNIETMSKDCFEQYFQGISRDKIASLESGTQDFQLIGPEQPKDEPMGVIFTDNAEPIGAIRFRFFSNGEVFKVESVVDSSCIKIEDYSNMDRGGDKNTLLNFDSLQMHVGNANYHLRVGYDGSIDVDFRKFSP